MDTVNPGMCIRGGGPAPRPEQDPIPVDPPPGEPIVPGDPGDPHPLPEEPFDPAQTPVLGR